MSTYRQIDPAAASRSQFDRQAAAYAESVPHSSSASLHVIERLASERRYGRAVDIATGPGFTAFAVAPYCEKVIATDISEQMLEQVIRLAAERGLGNVSTEVADATSMPWPDGSVDLLTCRTAPHHFASIAAFLAEVKRVLVPGGTLLLADTCTSEDAVADAWHNEMELRRDPSHIRCLSPAEWLAALELVGLPSDFHTFTRVNMEFNSWTERSGTPSDEIDQLRSDWAKAPEVAVAEFELTASGEGSFSFSWPVFVSRSRKNQPAS